MKGKINIYCDMEFWKSFMDSCSNIFDISVSNKEWKEIESKRYLYSRLVEDTFLHLKCSEKELLEELEREDAVYHETMRILDQKQQARAGGEGDVLDCSYDYDNNKFPSLDSNAVYFTNNIQTRSTIEKNGCLAVSLSDLLSSRYNNERPIEVNKGQFSDWQVILNAARHTCNSLLICDSYILNNLEDNLYPIIDLLIPNDICEVFQLTIITSEGSTFGMGEQLKRAYHDIHDHLLKSGKKTLVELVLVRTDTSQQHDRKILSNNIYVDCSGGFDLLKKKKATKQTTVGISFPKFANPRDFDTYFNVIEQAKRIIRSNLVVSANNDQNDDPSGYNRIFLQSGSTQTVR